MRHALWPDEVGLDGEIAAYLASRFIDAVTFVAERPTGGLAGFVEVGTRSYAEGCETQPVAYIEGWYVDPDWRRQSVGRALLGAVEAWARTAGHREVGSDVELDNTVSLAAHRAAGYEEVVRLVCFRRTVPAAG